MAHGRYEVLVDRRVEKDLRKVARHIAAVFLSMLDSLAENPTTPRPGFDVKKLSGMPGDTYRVRLGDYRVVFALDRKMRGFS